MKLRTWILSAEEKNQWVAECGEWRTLRNMETDNILDSVICEGKGVELIWTCGKDATGEVAETDFVVKNGRA